MIQSKRNHFGMLREERMDGPLQIPDAFAVNDTHLENAPFPANGQVIRHKIFYLARIESVQIQHAINWQLNRLVHRPSDYILAPQSSTEETLIPHS